MADAEAAAALQAQITAAVVAALAAQAAAAAPVAHVAVKLPDFWVKDPKMWFSQAEAQFLHPHEVAGGRRHVGQGPGFGD
jgi:L-alanine-DL-glutamate epimerase-like enolase superfamily enzyme